MQKKYFKESLLVLALPIILWSGSLRADVPRVVADIVPIHSLVSMVMDGLGEPQLLISQNASPHDYSMRPSEAKALQEASLVVYLGHDMTPWLEPILETVAASADALDLSEVEGVLKLPYRDGPIFDDHTGHADHEEEGHDEHEDEAHADHEEEGHDDHHHGENDPHMWLDPDNAVTWLNAIASRLGRIDPTNANRYTANAKSAIQQIKYTAHKIEDQVASIQGNRFIVYHDAYQYFEERFGVTAAGSISLGDASKPSPKRLRQLKNLFEDGQINCVLSEPQYSSKLIDSVFAGYKPYIGSVDPIGIDLKLGPTLYFELLENVAFNIAQCVNH
ncbi:zinc ABC transporter substrate-binding protein [Gammaproteobacteria bacterium]|nr:zinc ABC transporter substrate-binding protein [Gammaproteobacteria bacterium]